MTTFLFGLATLFICELPAPDLVINEDSIPETQGYLSYPHDVMVHEDRIYIADQSSAVLVFKNGVFEKSFGSSGEGPDEFRHPPTRLYTDGNQLFVTEMYGWSRSIYSLDGVFQFKESLDQKVKKIGDTQMRELKPLDALKQGKMVRYNDCLLGNVDGPDSMGFHYASFVYDMLADGTFFFVKRRGQVEVYDKHCGLSAVREMNIARFAKEPEYSQLFTDISRSLLDRPMKRYYYGHPIYAAAAENHQSLWLLASNEHLETPMDRMNETWLLNFALDEEKMEVMEKLPMSASRIKIFGGKLAIIFKEEAIIHFYDLQKLKAAFRQN